VSKRARGKVKIVQAYNIGHVMREGRGVVNHFNDGGRRGHHRIRVCSGRLLVPDVDHKGRRVPDQTEKLPRGGFWIVRRHDGADYGDAVQALLCGEALKHDALQVRLVDAADADGLGAVPRLGDLLEDLTHASGADDLLGVGLSVLCQQLDPSMLETTKRSRWSGIDGADAEIVSAALAGLQCLLDGADRDSDDLVRP